MSSKEILIFIGDLVYYVGPPIVNPLSWERIVENDNGIINKDDIGIVIEADSFLRIADVFFQKQDLSIERISFKYLRLA